MNDKSLSNLYSGLLQLFCVCCILMLALPAEAQNLYVGSYNIRYKNDSDSLNGHEWNKRCQVICDQVNFESPDVWGAQEVLYSQLCDLLKGLDDYDYIGVGRDDGKRKGEYAPVFYKKDRVRLLDSGHFWLNETPDVPKLGWDAACVRICTWGKFKDKRSNRTFYYFNLHMDHVGVVARRQGAHLVVERIKEIAKGNPVVLTGDFNVDQRDEIYNIFTDSGILKDSYQAARIRFAENGTFNNFKTQMKTRSRIDHVFVSPKITVDAYGVLTNGYWTPNKDYTKEQKDSGTPREAQPSPWIYRNPSDHYPVFVKLSL